MRYIKSMYEEMPEYYEPWAVVKEIPGFYAELSEKEAGVLCGLIKEKRPKKIVEVGCAAGGSTSLILKSLEILGLSDTIFYSIDLNEMFYRKQVGLVSRFSTK